MTNNSTEGTPKLINGFSQEELSRLANYHSPEEVMRLTQARLPRGAEDIMYEAFVASFEDFIKSDEFKSHMRPYRASMVVSDMNEKILRRIANKKGDYTEDEISTLMYIMGKGNGNIDPSEDGEWSDDMVQEYADNLRNFLYTYKESACDIDPSIDPSEPHRGPMAQDIEKVAPDCVNETNGTKVVDGNRLALVNAGVIGDLARRVIALEDRLNAR